MISASRRLVRSREGRREALAYANYVMRQRGLRPAVAELVDIARNHDRNGPPKGLMLTAGPERRVPSVDFPIAVRPPRSRPLAAEFRPGEAEEALAAHRFGWIPPLLAAGLPDEHLAAEVKGAVVWAQRHPHAPDCLGWDSYSVAERIVHWVQLASAARRWHVSVDLIELRQAIDRHAAALRSALEFRGEATNNHLINDGRALYLAGAFLGDEASIRLGAELVRYGARTMLTPSGFLREGSSHYHLLLCRTFLEVLAMASASGDESLLADVSDPVIAMCRRSAFLLATGNVPLIGDASPDVPAGFLDGVPSAAAAVLAVPLAIPVPEAAGWHRLLLPGPPVIRNAPADVAIESFDDAGFHRVATLGPTLTVYVNPMGHVPAWSHGHADLGGFVLEWMGVPLLVDCGRATYEHDEIGSYGRSVRSHNAISIDGHEPSVVHAHNGFIPPMLPRYAGEPPRVQTGSSGGMATLRLEHDGFTRIAPGFRLSRVFEVSKEALRISDEVGGRGPRTVETFFHLHPNVIPVCTTPGAVELEAGGRRLVLSCASDGASRIETARGLYGRSTAGWFSAAYGRVVPTTTIRFVRRGLPHRATYLIEEKR